MKNSKGVNNNNNNNNNNNKKKKKKKKNFEIRIDEPIPDRRPDLRIVKKKKKKRICWILDFVVPVDHNVNIKESEKRDKYPGLARKLKNYGI